MPLTCNRPDEAGTGSVPGGSDAEALAALGATSADDGLATAGLHAGQKAVGALAANHRGLIRAFHCLDSRKKPAITTRCAGTVNVFSEAAAEGPVYKGLK